MYRTWMRLDSSGEPFLISSSEHGKRCHDGKNSKERATWDLFVCIRQERGSYCCWKESQPMVLQVIERQFNSLLNRTIFPEAWITSEIVMLWWEWLGRLKWCATGLDASVLFCSASRRCSRRSGRFSLTMDWVLDPIDPLKSLTISHASPQMSSIA